MLQCEKYLHASFGVYGGKRMIETFEDKKRTMGEIISMFFEMLYL